MNRTGSLSAEQTIGIKQATSSVRFFLMGIIKQQGFPSWSRENGSLGSRGPRRRKAPRVSVTSAPPACRRFGERNRAVSKRAALAISRSSLYLYQRALLPRDTYRATCACIWILTTRARLNCASVSPAYDIKPRSRVLVYRFRCFINRHMYSSYHNSLFKKPGALSANSRLLYPTHKLCTRK